MMSPGITSPLLKLKKLVGKHLQERQQKPAQHLRKVKRTKTRQWITSLPSTEAVYDGRPSDDRMEDLNVNVAKWGIFMNATLEAAIHIGNDHDANLRNVENSSWRSAGQLFRETERLISGQTETTGASLIDSQH